MNKELLTCAKGHLALSFPPVHQNGSFKTPKKVRRGSQNMRFQDKGKLLHISAWCQPAVQSSVVDLVVFLNPPLVTFIMCILEDVFHVPCGHWAKQRIVSSACVIGLLVPNLSTGCWTAQAGGVTRSSDECASCKHRAHLRERYHCESLFRHLSADAVAFYNQASSRRIEGKSLKVPQEKWIQVIIGQEEGHDGSPGSLNDTEQDYGQ
jgi:hypothetical protein